MFFCNDEIITILKVIKVIYYICSYIIVIGFIFFAMIKIFNGIIKNKEDEMWRGIGNNLFYVVIYYLLPTIIFFVFTTLIPVDIMDINSIKSCWNIALI